MSYVISINGIMSAGVSRYYCMYRSEKNTKMAENTLAIAKRLYWCISGASLFIVFALIIIMRSVYASSFSTAQLDECSAMLVVLGINTAVSMNNTINVAAITAEERFVFLKASQLFTLIVQPLLVVILMNFFPNALMVTVVVLTMNIACASIQRLYAQSILKVSYTFHGWDKKLVKGLLGFSVSIVMVVAADQLFWKTGQLIIGYYGGAALVAVYAVGAQIYYAYMNSGTVVSSVFFPRVSELYHGKHDTAALSSLYANVGRITFIICGTVLGAFLVLGDDFIRLWAGNDYIDAYYVASLVMIGLTVDLIQNLANTIMQVADRYFFRGVVLLALSCVSVVLSVMAFRAIGIAGVALSTAAATLIGNGIIINWYLWRCIGIDVKQFWKQIFGLAVPHIAVTCVFAVLYWSLPVPHGTWRTFFIGGLAYLAIMVVTWWRFGLSRSEKDFVLNLVVMIKKRSIAHLGK